MKGVTYHDMGANNRERVNDKPVSFRMPSELHAALAKLAKAEKRTVSNYMVFALDAHVAQHQPSTPTATKKKGKK